MVMISYLYHHLIIIMYYIQEKIVKQNMVILYVKNIHIHYKPMKQQVVLMYHVQYY